MDYELPKIIAPNKRGLQIMKTKHKAGATITKIISILLACMILLSIVGCKTQRPETPEPESNPADTTPPAITAPDTDDEYIPEGSLISTEDLAEALRQKYEDVETINFQESLWDLPKNQEFYTDFAFDLVEDTGYSDFTEVFAVYTNAELTETVSAAWEIVTHEDDPAISEGHNRVYVRPGRTAAGRVWGHYYDLITRQRTDLDEAGEYYLHEQGEFESWGFLKHYYLVQHIDATTAEPLERPLVTIFTIENQLEAPNSEFYITDNGSAAFRWNQVAGADYYLVVEIDEFSTIWPIDKATGTNWEYPHSDDTVLMNQAFGGRTLTDDEMQSMDDDFERREATYRNYSVIAVNSQVHSPLGTIHRGEDLAARLPRSLALNTIRQDAEETDGNPVFVPSVGLLPTHKAISMADGSTVHRRMIYDFSFVEIKNDRWMHYDGYDRDGNFINPRFEEHTNLHINYVIEGTVFNDRMVVIDVDEATVMMELETFRQMIGDTTPLGGGNTETEVDKSTKTESSKTSKDAPPEILDRTKERIFANSALSEFFAVNLLAANEMIDLSGFPESADWEKMLDAFLEAMYQNPLVLHVEAAYSAPGTNLLIVEYREPTRKIHEQQAALRDIVPKIAAQIITPGMTDLEKSFAINKYLIENAEYDFAALQEAERNNFQSVDARFNDSFTAYGILINGVGVCSGYADAFKLIADEAGLEAIIVTGFLEGTLPHAWNRVNIDGQWHTVDVTNNANEYLLNAFLNLPDTAAGKLLVEDSQFMMSAFIPRYRSTDSNSEYYTVTGRFFDTSEIARELAQNIRQNGSTTLRTDYNLDDEAFYEIAMEVMEILNTRDLFGFYMLGVIWMSDSP